MQRPLLYKLLMDVDESANPFRRAAPSVFKRYCPGRMPAILPIFCPHPKTGVHCFISSNGAVSAASVLEDATEMVQPLADRAGIKILVDGFGCKELHLQADRQRLVHVLVNLLGNGIKYNRPNGQVTVTCRAVDKMCGRLEISDTGFGITAEDQKRLFEPFQRFGDQVVEGTGLGLAISERLVRLMGGRLLLSESSISGSTFCIELSCSAHSDEISEAGSHGDSLPPSLSACTGTVLYVEDNPANLRLLEMVFAGAPNLTLLTAASGNLGIELAIQRQPDVILLDLHLPDQNGDEVLRRLKTESSTQWIPVVMISADATPKQMRTLRAAGAVEYLTKPIDLRRLFAVLAEFLPVIG